jgi:CheY-like chemotaxis protein
VAERPRILAVGGQTPDWLRRCQPDGEVVPVASWDDALERLRHETADGLVCPADAAARSTLADLLRAPHLLAALPDGVALVDFDLRVRWCNPAFAAWCCGAAVGRGVYEALGSPEGAADYCPFHTALALRGDGRNPVAAITCRVQARDGRHLELHLTPLREEGPAPDAAPLLLVVGRDVSELVQQQQMLEALHKAGRELAPLDPQQLAEMSVAERIDLLKQNIRRFTRELLHYQSIEVRLMDRRTGRLEPLVQEGMSPEAAGRELRPNPEGEGVTGFVAATGRPHLCPDTGADPLYLPGAAGARSSLTVPLIYQDQVVGTLNVESPEPDAFGPDDVRFAELFAREVAEALHTLELLSAERHSSASQSVEAVSREVALPVDEILAATAYLLDRYIGHEPEMAARLRQILGSARSIKEAIQRVGEHLAPGERAETVSGPKPPPSLRGQRVLVADSDERVRRSAHSLLGRWGCVVETARDAQEALTMARIGTYDAILADIRLPDMPGYEAYRRLREAQPRARLVLMTGYGYDPGHTLVKARQDGLRHVLFKPFRVDQLFTALGTPDTAAEKTPRPD